MPTTVIITLSIASIILAGAGLLIGKIWRDSETNNKSMREDLIELNKQTYESLTNLNEQVSRLSVSITALNGTVMAQADQASDFKLNCADHKKSVNERLTRHGLQLDKHETEIAVIKQIINK